jgi:hypothetical protein
MKTRRQAIQTALLTTLALGSVEHLEETVYVKLGGPSAELEEIIDDAIDFEWIEPTVCAGTHKPALRLSVRGRLVAEELAREAGFAG